MLKTTSLVTAVPFTLDLYGITSREIAARDFEPVPLLLVAAFWYLVVTSILMVGQYYLERYFARGASRKLTTKQLEALAKAQGPGAPGGGGEAHDTDGEGRRGLQELRRAARPEGHHAGDRQGRGAVHGRPVRLGQVDVPALHQPSGAGQCGPAVCRRRPDRLPRRRRQAARDVAARRRQAAPRDRDGVPALQPVPASHGAGERHRGTGPRQGRQEGRRDGARQGSAGPGRTGGEGRRPIRRSSPAASSSGSRSRAPWR